MPRRNTFFHLGGLTLGLMVFTVSPTFSGGPPEKILIGGPISLSGKYAKEGTQGLWGFQVAEKWVNEVYGGVKIQGKKVPIQYVHDDDESKKDIVSRVIERMITREGVKFMLAPYSSGLTISGASIAENHRVLYMSHGGASDRIFEQGYRYVAQTIVPASRYQVDVLDMMKAIDPKAGTVAFVFKDTVFTRSVREGAVRYAEKLGFEAAFDRFYRSDVDDLTPVLAAIGDNPPDLLIGGGHFSDGQLLARQMGELQINVHAASILVSPTLPAFYKALGTMAEGILSPAQWEKGVRFSPEATPDGVAWFGPGENWFIRAFREVSGGAEPDYHGAQAAAAILAYVKAIENADSLDTDKVRKAMSDLRFMSFYGDWGIDPRTGKQVAHQSVLVQWQNRRKEIVWPEKAQTAEPCYPMPAAAERARGAVCKRAAPR